LILLQKKAKHFSLVNQPKNNTEIKNLAMSQLQSILSYQKNQHTNAVSCEGKSAPFFRSFIQPKLTINQPNDAYEQEADAMADKVMRMQDIQQRSFFSPAIGQIQRKCARCEKEEKQMHHNLIEGDGAINEMGELEGDEHLGGYINNLENKGSPLDNSSKKFFEPRFGYNFNNVRVHTDAVAAKSAQSINALAFTSGNNIVFNAGQYNPHTDSGKKLLAHELTHVVQQGNSVYPKHIQRLSVTRFSLAKNSCGQRQVRWAFNLANAATAEGYIVQKVERYQILSNSCPAISGPPAPAGTFWEAFPVRKGASEYFRQTGRGYSDTSGFPAHANSNGTDAVYGTLKFFLKSATGDLGDFGVAPATSNGWGPGLVSTSGSLPSTSSEPSWWNNTPVEGTTTRNAISQWDCCSDPNYNSVTSSP
jgi:hypothetical protein